MRLALYTFGQFAKPSDHPDNDGFHAANDAVLAEIEGAPGFIARSGYASDPGPESWGVEIYPRFYRDSGDGWAPATLSLWQDLESPMAATYSGMHMAAYRQGAAWFQRGDWPPLVVWWINDGTTPVWADGVRRMEYLHDHGPTAQGFSFRRPFDRQGHATRIDQARLKTLQSGVPTAGERS